MTSAPPPIVPLTTELSTLEASCTGRILRAGDPRTENYLGSPDDPGRLDAALVVLADCVHDLGAAVRFARRAGVAAVVLGGARPADVVPADAVVIVVNGLCGVDVDPGTATARVGIGASWAGLRDAADAVGLDSPVLAPLDGTVGPTLAQLLDRPPAEPGTVGDAIVAVQVVDASGRTRFRSDGAGVELVRRAHDDGQVVTALDLRLRGSS